MFRIADGVILDEKRLACFIEQHKGIVAKRYQALMDAYLTDYPILHGEYKPSWKPDNRLVVNFAKYIVDTMAGFFLGIPVKVSCDDANITKYVNFLSQYNDQEDQDAELSKICSIFGKGYEMYYVDPQGNIGITYLSPLEAFVVYADAIVERPRYFVRLYTDAENVLRGSISDETTVRYFSVKGELVFEEEGQIHGFDGVPVTEFRENSERMGMFEPALTLINAYNKALSEKANDVDYFADAYLKILGVYLDEDELKYIRDDRIINFEGDTEKLIVEFLQKPNGDETQEHLIDRLEKLIFQIAMVANISDENFGEASGISLKYKLQAMSNLAKTKERKFASGMNRRYRLIFSNPVSGMNKADWVKLQYQFTLNYPANLLEEAQVSQTLEGIVSKTTQLKVLSLVDNVKDEIDRLEAEADAAHGVDAIKSLFVKDEDDDAQS